MNQIENNIPNFLIEMLNSSYGKETTKKILEGYTKTRPATFRVNLLKTSAEEVKEELQRCNIKFTNVKWSSDAFVVNQATKNDIEQLEIYKDGKIYMQSLSSMLPVIALAPKPNMDILDMAAAPGGKTTQIASMTKNMANITACEMNHIRAERLKYNIQKQGASAYVMEIDSRRMDDFFSFDQILLDAPCSGSGTLNITQKNIDVNTKKLKNQNNADTIVKKSCQNVKAYARNGVFYMFNFTM